MPGESTGGRETVVGGSTALNGGRTGLKRRATFCVWSVRPGVVECGGDGGASVLYGRGGVVVVEGMVCAGRLLGVHAWLLCCVSVSVLSINRRSLVTVLVLCLGLFSFLRFCCGSGSISP